MRSLHVAAMCAALLAAPSMSSGQDAAPCDVQLRSTRSASLTEELARSLDALGGASTRSFMIRRLGEAVTLPVCDAPGAIQSLARHSGAPAAAPYSVVVHPLAAMLSQNSAYPRDWNDGALFNGVGISFSITGGATLRWGALEAALAPMLVAEQNDGFVMDPFPDSAYSRYLHRWHGRFIDLPQRHGRDSRAFVDAGQSYIAAKLAGVRTGFSTQNIVWGPAQRNPLLLSGTAPGFMHFFAETDGLRRLGPVDGEAQFFIGRLKESEYYDFDATNDDRALFGLAGAVRPRGADGLYLGAGYLHMQEWNDATSLDDLVFAPLSGLDPDSAGLSRELRLFSLFFRWVGAPGGLEVYGEWARQDSWKEWIRLLNPLDAPQAYSLGLQKLIRRGDNAVRFSAEFSHLADPIGHATLGRGVTTFYVSPYVRQGHTHRGQLLGAPIGPGSEAQFVGVDVFTSRGRSTVSVERVRYDDDAYHAVWGRHHATHGHDTEISLRAGHAMPIGPLRIDALVGYSRRHSRSFLGLTHVNYPGYPYRAESNFALRLEGVWQPTPATWTLR